MQVIFDKAKVMLDGEQAYLCLAIPYRDAQKFVMEMQPRKYVAKIEEYRAKRSLDANAYMWVLLDKLAAVLGTTKNDLYLHYVRDYGPYRDWPLALALEQTFCKAWGNQGTGWPTERIDYDGDNAVVVRAYYGTSTYTTKQMTRIISAIVEDCKDQGIDTMTPAEIIALGVGRP